MLHILNINAGHAVAEGIAHGVIAHKDLPCSRSEVAVFEQIVLNLEAFDRILGILAVHAVGFGGQITELHQPLLIYPYLIAGIAYLVALADSIGIIESFLCQLADLAVRAEIVCRLKFLYGITGRFIKHSVLVLDMLEITELIEPALNIDNVAALIAEHGHINLGFAAHQQLICSRVEPSGDLKLAPALEKLDCAFGDGAEIIGGFILIHVPKLHEPKLHINYNIIMLTAQNDIGNRRRSRLYKLRLLGVVGNLMLRGRRAPGRYIRGLRRFLSGCFRRLRSGRFRQNRRSRRAAVRLGRGVMRIGISIQPIF